MLKYLAKMSDNPIVKMRATPRLYVVMRLLKQHVTVCHAAGLLRRKPETFRS